MLKRKTLEIGNSFSNCTSTETLTLGQPKTHTRGPDSSLNLFLNMTVQQKMWPWKLETELRVKANMYQPRKIRAILKTKQTYPLSCLTTTVTLFATLIIFPGSGFHSENRGKKNSIPTSKPNLSLSGSVL